MKLSFEKLISIGLIAVLFVILVLELNVTLGSPIAFGDEGVHARWAQLIGEEVQYPVWTPFGGTDLIKDGFYRPPLFNILEGSFIFLLGHHQIILKAITPFIAFLTGLATYLLVKRLYNHEIAFIASVILVTMQSFISYAVLLYSDMLLTFYLALFFLTFLIAVKENNRKYMFLSAVFAGLAFLTKHGAISALVFLPLAFFYTIIKERNLYHNLRQYFAFAIIFLLVVSPFLIRNIYYYQTPL